MNTTEAITPSDGDHFADFVFEGALETKEANARALDKDLHRMRQTEAMDRCGVDDSIRLDHPLDDARHVVVDRTGTLRKIAIPARPARLDVESTKAEHFHLVPTL
ncbi:hypothetical protein QA640_20395 [Bradyrhizobium sp. CB82]|uniref:hypothetical protein n=1 Tax=Bradyrhizobium sp. CB82 TaxID=3039159 RepID=UPI0024B271DF|nr:hypothetical protein [Bradyrhizobium sp. CB82]WFU44597.1 hypothetical protein QA640_20395 [Bradyrhizobium sp. CB82]